MIASFHSTTLPPWSKVPFGLAAMKEAREAAGFAARPDASAQADEAAERIARHREDGALLADLLDEIAARADVPAEESAT